MKKLLRKRFLFLVALLVGLCVPTMAQKDYSGAELNDQTVYYVRNVATGLFLKYGSSWGSHVTEAVSAHPIMFQLNDDKTTYAISSIYGYLGSAEDMTYMDLPKNDSKWMIVSVGDDTNSCYLQNESGQFLASFGNASGVLKLCSFEEGDMRQKWQILKDTDLRPSEPLSNLSVPLNLTPLVQSSSFDLFDAVSMKARYEGEHQYQYGENGEVIKDTIINKVEFPYYLLNQSREYYNNFWSVYRGTTINDDYSYGPEKSSFWTWVWDVALRQAELSGYNSCGVLEHSVRADFTISQQIGRLPKGIYSFSFEGFSRVLYKYGLFSEKYYSLHAPVFVEIVDANGNVLNSEVSLAENTDIAVNETYYNFITGGAKVDGLLKGQYASTQFRDNDKWKKTVNFEITDPTDITIRLRRDALYTKSSIPHILAKKQSFVAFDNFNLIYHGTTTNPEPWRDLYYDRVKVVYDATQKKVDALDDFNMEGCNHNSVWTDNCKVTLDTTNEIAYLNGNKIDAESEFLEALANIEYAYQEALKEHRMHHLVLDQNSTTLPEINKEFKSVTVKRPVTANDKWTTFAVPFPISEDSISVWGWDVRELVSSRADAPDANGKQNITLTFGKVKAIEASKPYMVKVKKSMDEFVVKNVPVNTTTSTSRFIEGSNAVSSIDIDDVEFIGVYTMRFMPVGVYFVNSNNQYKRVVKENNNLIRGYRAYIKLLDESGVARSLGYRWGDETGIDSANNDEVTIVGIYNLNGMRLDDMQEGVNILRMSDGSTMKVIIK